MAGCHLWDEETNVYNKPFIQRLLPVQRVACLTLSLRRLGLIIPSGNPASISDLASLTRSDPRFVNRQRGAGTRAWFDAQLRRRGIAPEQIAGYEHEVTTHSEVARAIAADHAAVGLGIETAALTYGLQFICLTTERYDLVIPAGVWRTSPIQALVRWLSTSEAKSAIEHLGGYNIEETGRVEWVGG